MFIQFLGEQVEDKVEVEHEPKWPKIKEAIEKLDGDKRTLVGLEASPEVHMAIGGGANGWCVVGVQWTDGKFYRMIAPGTEDPDELIELAVGGSSGVYPKEMLVQQADALKAAKPFAEEGKLEPSFEWREQKVEVYSA